MAIILDASVLIAYLNKDDVHHTQARELMMKIKANTYGVETTTDYVFDEVLSVVQRKISQEEACLAGKYLLESLPLTITNDLIFVRAWHLFKKTSNLSFTDCTLLAFMREYSFQYLATFDKGFKAVKGIQVVGC